MAAGEPESERSATAGGSGRLAGEAPPPSVPFTGGRKRRGEVVGDDEHVMVEGRKRKGVKTSPKEQESWRVGKAGGRVKSKKDAVTAKPDPHPAKKQKKSEEKEEKRLKRFRKHEPVAYKEVKERAMTQRMFVIDRKRGGTPECPEEEVDIAGTTGNVYTVSINKVPSCTCPHARKGNQCKHIIYVLVRVLRAPEHLQYQLAFLTPELHQIIANAPPIPSASATSDNDGRRKPLEDDCPICCCEFEPDSEETVYCKAACGNNVHKRCFEQWAASKRGAVVTCPFCRTPWQAEDGDAVKSVAKSGNVNEEGYVNVGRQLGLSGERDYSTYHQFWARRNGYM